MIHPTKQYGFGPYIKALAKAHGKDIMPDVRLPRKPRSDKGQRRAAYDRAEDRDRPVIMKMLRRDGWKIWRVEPYGRISKTEGFGLGDLWGVHLNMRQAGFIECKSRIGKLSDDQKKRIEEHKLCGINHWVVRLDGEGNWDGYLMKLWTE